MCHGESLRDGTLHVLQVSQRRLGSKKAFPRAGTLSCSWTQAGLRGVIDSVASTMWQGAHKDAGRVLVVGSQPAPFAVHYPLLPPHPLSTAVPRIFLPSTRGLSGIGMNSSMSRICADTPRMTAKDRDNHPSRCPRWRMRKNVRGGMNKKTRTDRSLVQRNERMSVDVYLTHPPGEGTTLTASAHTWSTAGPSSVQSCRGATAHSRNGPPRHVGPTPQKRRPR